ncbi:hypothetical protein QMK33_07160 [Hymenobacter sp. H14-R3]|uniref:hypothetical protein n=1 Tax=Hymenobacter sp. H14-R3 TaxID=3046308 RepID=UPI0024BB9A34|nr:hypothetical protein [Hymenobacter sp. H14-R3]MDJ0364926.1 hypothetical protein [Hymenobacter sp. H14-R3]
MPADSRTIYFKNSIGCIWEEPQAYLRLDYYPGLREEGQFRSMLTHLRQAMQRHSWSRVLINQQQMNPFTPAEESWMNNEWLPRAVQENGYRYGAVLVAHDVFARLAMNSVLATSRRLGHLYRNFEGETDAVNWLLGQ